MSPNDLANKNSDFWNEMCGTSLAKSLGITEINENTLEKFDNAYFEMYPYLKPFVSSLHFEESSVIEIGLGFGTLSQYLASRSKYYLGMDIAFNPVQMVNSRIHRLNAKAKAVQVDFLKNNISNEEFDYVVTIGCLHHTGNLAACIKEVHRILKPGGTAKIMVYNKYSFRQWTKWPIKTLFLNKVNTEEQRMAYDSNGNGEAAPFTEFSSIAEIKRMFSDFDSIQIEKQNMDPIILIRRLLHIPRKYLLNNIGKVLGLDLYVTAVKKG
jgi:SAM-dependent methyltransferase